jgi:hypothetical protein
MPLEAPVMSAVVMVFSLIKLSPPRTSKDLLVGRARSVGRRSC